MSLNIAEIFAKFINFDVKNYFVLKKIKEKMPCDWGSNFVSRHPLLGNIVIICIIALLGIFAVSVVLALFTKHACSGEVPRVEGKSYSQAIEIMNDNGFKVEIRDSLYKENVRPGYVIEQFPKEGSMCKPGRKIFLYINAVSPKMVILDDDNHPEEYAMKGVSPRTAEAKLEELGFKNVSIVKVLGVYDRVVKVLANGSVVKKMQKIPINSKIILEVSDGRLNSVKDSLQNAEYQRTHRSVETEFSTEENTQDESSEII